MSAPFVTHFAAESPVCTPRESMVCGFCKAWLYDCACPRNPECKFCELSPEDADFVCSFECQDSPDGKHVFVETAGES